MGFGSKKLAQLFFYKEKSCIFVADFQPLALGCWVENRVLRDTETNFWKFVAQSFAE